MAKILDKDPVVYNRERDVFMRDLQHFHDTRGTKFRRPPAISGYEIDLYLLYNIVTAKGGWVKVTSRNEWDGMLEHFGLPTQCVNSGVALKQIYIRFLDRYEKVHYLGEEADRGSDDDEESRHKRWSARAMHSVPLTYNHHQHNITEANRSYNGLSADLYKSSDYDKLMLSLLSPLPNEQDYAINVCTLLSNEGKHVLKLEKCPKIVDYLLAHAGVFNHSSLRPIFLETYSNVRHQPISSFWYDTLESQQFTDLMVESKFTKRKTILPVVGPIKKEKSSSSSRRDSIKTEKKEEEEQDAKVQKDDTDKETKTDKTEPETVVPDEVPQKESDDVVVVQETENFEYPSTSCDKSAPAENDVIERLCDTEDNAAVDETDDDSAVQIIDPTPSDDCDDSNLFAPSDDESRRGKQKVKLKIGESDGELFCLGRTLGTQDYIGQRVLQIADILRNLSFTEENVTVLANNISFLRFSLLCTSSRWNTLHQYGFDMLSNVATELLVKDPIRDRLTECLLITITQGLTSADRFVIISCLDVLNKLSQNEANEDVLIRYLEQNVYEQVCLFLTIQDIMLLVYTLECLYSLSSLGERACNSIIKVHGVIDVLVALITVEAQSYGPKACIGMKVIETVPQGGVITPTTSQTTITTTPMPTSTVTTTMTSLSNVTVSSINSPVFSTPSLVTVATPIARNTPSLVAPTPRIVQNTYTPITSQPTITVPQPPVQLAQTVQQIQHQLTANSPNQNVQQQHAHQQAIQENEHFAQAWLRATFEPDVKSRVEQQELYRNYLNSCSKMGRKGVIAPLHFPRIVRCVFGGTVGPNPTKFDNLLYYEGIKLRPTPLVNTYTPPTPIVNTQPQPRPATPIKTTNRRTKTPTMQMSVPSATPDSTANDIMVTTPPPSPASPILKAQLSAPSKIKESPVKIDTNKCQASAHPHLSQALLGSNIPSPVVSNAQKDNSAATISTVASASSSSTSSSTVGNQQQSNSSLIKSLLATKVNDCMPVISMTPASVVTMPECSVPATVVPQVAQRQQQQRLLSQQLQSQPSQQISSPQPVIQVNKNVKSQKQGKNDSAKIARVNGARTPIQENELLDSLVSSTVQGAMIDNRGSVQNSVQRGRNTQVPPPLAPLSTSTVGRQAKTNKIESEDSDSTGNNSVASSSGLGTIQSNAISDNVSSTEDGENSLTSFEGLLLNGIQNSIDIDAPCVDDNATNIPIIKPKSQSLMLADLLEKKIEKKEPPLMNGVIGKELRIGEKGLELVENHIERVLMSKNDNSKLVSPPNVAEDTKVSVIVSSDTVELAPVSDSLTNNGDNVLCNKVIDDDIMEIDAPVTQTTLKRPAEEPGDVQVKRPNNSSVIVTNTSINGNAAIEEVSNKETPPMITMTGEGDDNEGGSVSSTAANLYAALAADVLDEEDLDEEAPVQPVPPAPTPPMQMPMGIQQNNLTLAPAPPLPVQVPMSVQQPQQQQLIVHSNNRPIIVTQAQISNTGQVLFTAGGQIIQQQPTVTTMKTGPQGMPVLVQTGSASPSMQQQRVMLSQMHQGMQFVASGTQPGQYVLSSGTGAGQTTYVMAQPQTALVQGQAQTVLVAQTSQQQGAKTIIILQPQTATAQATHHQKVVMTPQGQQVVVTQVSRPMLQSPTVGNAMSSALVSTANQVQQSIATAVTSMTSPSIVQNVQNLQNCATVVTPPTQSTLNKIVTSNASVTTNNNSISKVIVESTNGAVNRDINTTTQQMLSSNLSANSKMAKLTTATTRPQQPFSVQRTTVLDYPFICEWKGCTSRTSFKSANEVLLHACDAHCPTGSEEIQCLWERCDNMKRKRFSLMTHLIDRHCNTEAMKASAARRKQLSQMGRADLPTPNPPAPHPGYAPDAAFHAIKRHALEFVNPKELMDDNEGPVTKSIRLTSSLILRNLVIYSNNSRRYLRHYEPHLASVALSNVESSRTIAQVLYDLNDSGSRR